jgi:hypothetical protein
MEKDGIVLNFQEEPNSLAAVLMAYIKKSPASEGTDKAKQDLIASIMNIAGIDNKIWRVKSFKLTPNSWGVTMKQKETEKGSTKTWAEQAQNYQLKVEIYFERNLPYEDDITNSFKELMKDMPAISIVESRKRRIIKDNGIAGEMAIYDPHFGKLAWKDETGYRHYDTKIASKDYSYVTENCLDLLAPAKPEKIFYVIGQDLYHIDNMGSHTTGGDHTLDVDGRITKIHKTVFINMRDALYKTSRMSPVEVIWIPGNHDYLASYMLVFALKEHFRGYSRITFDITENPRKARLWGNLLVGWAHRIVGKPTVWSNELSQAFPELWGKSMFREWHHGDQHKKQDVKITPVFTSGGVVCRQMTALSPVDQWHTTNVFTDAVPGGEAYLWSKEKGVFANFTAWTGQYDDYRNKLINKK